MSPPTCSGRPPLTQRQKTNGSETVAGSFLMEASFREAYERKKCVFHSWDFLVLYTPTFILLSLPRGRARSVSTIGGAPHTVSPVRCTSVCPNAAKGAARIRNSAKTIATGNRLAMAVRIRIFICLLRPSFVAISARQLAGELLVSYRTIHDEPMSQVQNSRLETTVGALYPRESSQSCG